MATKIDGCQIEQIPFHRPSSSLQQTIMEEVSPFLDITGLQSDLGINTNILLDKFVINMCTNEKTLEGSLKTNVTSFGSDVRLITKWKLNIPHNVDLGVKHVDFVSAKVDIKNELYIKGQNIEVSLGKEKNSLEFKQEIKASKLGMALYAEVVLSESSRSGTDGSSEVNVEIRNPELVHGNSQEGRITFTKKGE